MQKLEKNKIYGSALFITDLLPEQKKRVLSVSPWRSGYAACAPVLLSVAHTDLYWTLPFRLRPCPCSGVSRDLEVL